MGGQAFATAGPDGSALNVPRMTPEVYRKCIDEIQSKLITVFRNVTIPHDAPGKQDHGDIDFLVEGSLRPWNAATLKELIGATHLLDNGRTTSYAVPYPESPAQYVQVDIETAPDSDGPDGPELFAWTEFFKSYSDLFQIIGICHRSLGIQCNDRGLHIRIKEIEPYNKKKGLMFLTRDPDKTMEFYGLDAAKYWEGFATEEELFQWVVSGRFFSRQLLVEREEKHNDRARHKKRPMYRRFVEDFFPSHPLEESEGDPWTREKVLEEALHMFGVQDQYEQMMAEHYLREREAAIWERIKENLPIESKSTQLMVLKSLRRWVDFADGQPFVTTEAMIETQPLWSAAVADEDRLMGWVGQNWQDIKALEKARAVSLYEGARAMDGKQTVV